MVLKDKCTVCGSKNNLTEHHLRDIHNKVYLNKINKKSKRRAPLVGFICLCRDCHDLVETIITKKKLKNMGYKQGYNQCLEDIKNKI